MTGKESKFWTGLSKSLPGFLLRIENTTQRGTPDVYWLFRGHSAWVELKVDDGAGTILRAEQKAFAERVAKYDGHYFVVSWLFEAEGVAVWHYPFDTLYVNGKGHLITEHPHFLCEKRKQRQVVDFVFDQTILNK